MFNDLVNNPNFGVTEMSEAISIVPNSFSLTSELALFTPKPIPTTSVILEYKQGVLRLLNSATRGASDGSVGQVGKRKLRSYPLLHIPHNEYIVADDIQGIRAFGDVNLESFNNVVNEKLMTAAGNHDITLEYHQMEAIKGRCVDADGTVLHNYFTDFGITEKSVNFALGTTSTDINAKCREISRHMQLQAKGETITGVRAICGPEWFDAFVKHPGVQDAYKYYSSVQEPLREDVRATFRHQGITFQEYLGSAVYLNEDGTSTERKFVADNECRFVPMGTRQTFITYFGPADYIETVNRPGLTRYAKLVPDRSGKAVTVETQQNPLSICTRPELLAVGTNS